MAKPVKKTKPAKKKAAAKKPAGARKPRKKLTPKRERFVAEGWSEEDAKEIVVEAEPRAAQWLQE